MNVTTHLAAKVTGSAIDGPHYPACRIRLTQRIRSGSRKLRLGKTVGPLAMIELRGTRRISAHFTFTAADYNLARLPKLPAA